MSRRSRCAIVLCFSVLACSVRAAAQNDPSWTERFEPFRIADNLYFVGTRGVSSFLFVTPQGNILLDTGVEEAVPLVRASVEKLGFKISDIKIILASHAHFDHVGGHALMQQLTGATVMAVGEDAKSIGSGTDTSALGASGWKPATVGRVLKDGETVALGGVTLTAHLTPGHTKGCTTWSTRVQHNGKSLFLVMIGGTSINAGVKLLNNPRHPSIVEDYARTFRVLKELKPDMFVAQHPSMFRMEDKVARLKGGDANAFIDPQGYQALVSSNEQAYLTQLKKEQGK
jgi:metallo-beta-lactamase class B